MRATVIFITPPLCRRRLLVLMPLISAAAAPPPVSLDYCPRHAGFLFSAAYADTPDAAFRRFFRLMPLISPPEFSAAEPELPPRFAHCRQAAS